MANIAYGIISTTIPADVTEIGEQEPDGVQFGLKATNKIAFYGATPIVQPIVGTTVASSASTTSLATSFNSLIEALSAAAGGLGLIA